jgi:acyl carrier protein
MTPPGPLDDAPRAPEARPPLAVAYVAPRDPREARVARIWEEVLAIAPIGVDDDFFDLGGASLQAIALIARVQRDFGVALSPRDLFGQGTVAAMSARIASLVAPA